MIYSMWKSQSELCCTSYKRILLSHKQECFTEKYTPHKTHTKLHPGLRWCIFDILTSEDLITSLIACLTLKLYLNLLVYDRDISRSPWQHSIIASSEIFRNPQQSFSKFLEKCLEAFVWPSLDNLETLQKSFKSGRKS